MTDAILKIDDLKVNFDGFWALSGVSLEVAKGELRVLIGPNGAGKSTLFDIVSGKTRASQGRVWFKDKDITGWSEERIAREGIGRKFQAPTVFTSLSVLENLEIANTKSFRIRGNLFARVTGLKNGRYDEVLARFGLSDVAHSQAGLLSHGQMQWLELAMTVIQDPDLLLLDEPTAGMTASETEQTSNIIKDLRQDHTVVVVEHDMDFVRRIGEVITVLHQGCVLAEGSAADIEANQDVKEAYLGRHGVSGADV